MKPVLITTPDSSLELSFYFSHASLPFICPFNKYLLRLTFNFLSCFIIFLLLLYFNQKQEKGWRLWSKTQNFLSLQLHWIDALSELPSWLMLDSSDMNLVCLLLNRLTLMLLSHVKRVTLSFLSLHLYLLHFPCNFICCQRQPSFTNHPPGEYKCWWFLPSFRGWDSYCIRGKDRDVIREEKLSPSFPFHFQEENHQRIEEEKDVTHIKDPLLSYPI